MFFPPDEIVPFRIFPLSRRLLSFLELLNRLLPSRQDFLDGQRLLAARTLSHLSRSGIVLSEVDFFFFKILSRSPP